MAKRRPRRRRMGFPEAGFLVAIVVAVAPLSYWWVGLNRPNWQTTAGSVLSGTIVQTHYNAETYESKVRLRYQYLAGTIVYEGAFEGFWPEIGGGNALDTSRLGEITTPGRPLVVSYDPEHPRRSTLFPDQEKSQLGYFLFSLGGLIAGGAYCLVAYPAMRRH